MRGFSKWPLWLLFLAQLPLLTIALADRYRPVDTFWFGITAGAAFLALIVAAKVVQRRQAAPLRRLVERLYGRAEEEGGEHHPDVKTLERAIRFYMERRTAKRTGEITVLQENLASLQQGNEHRRRRLDEEKALLDAQRQRLDEEESWRETISFLLTPALRRLSSEAGLAGAGRPALLEAAAAIEFLVGRNAGMKREETCDLLSLIDEVSVLVGPLMQARAVRFHTTFAGGRLFHLDQAGFRELLFRLCVS